MTQGNITDDDLEFTALPRDNCGASTNNIQFLVYFKCIIM